MEITNEQLIQNIDAIMGDYLKLMAEKSPIAARCVQTHCVQLIDAIKARLVAPLVAPAAP